MSANGGHPTFGLTEEEQLRVRELLGSWGLAAVAKDHLNDDEDVRFAALRFANWCHGGFYSDEELSEVASGEAYLRFTQAEEEYEKLRARAEAKEKLAAAGGGPLRVREADLSRSEPPRWLWRDRILLSYLNLLLGMEGAGKGTLWAWLAARLTHGDLDGDLHGTRATVAILGDEDSFDGVWTPRLHAAGADLSRVLQIDRPDGGFVSLARDRDRLREHVQQHSIDVLYLDALIDNLGVGVDDWRAKSVRDALQPARALARDLGVAVVGSLHPNKRGDSFRQLVAGSSAFNAVSRSSLLLADDPQAPARKVVVRGKGNHAAAPRAVTFAITSQTFTANGHIFDVPLAVDFEDGGVLSADDVIAEAQEQTRQTKVGNAEKLLQGLLKGGGWHLSSEIYEACAKQGFDERLVRRAGKKLGVQHSKEEKFQGGVEWCLLTAPPTVDTRLDAPTDVQDGQSVQSINTPANSSPDTVDTPDTPALVQSGVQPAKPGRKARNAGGKA